MRPPRVSRAEVLQAVRAQGCGELGRVAAVVLETDGSFSVITVSSAGTLDVLENVPDASGADTKLAACKLDRLA